MAKEIERKFLVVGDDWRALARGSTAAAMSCAWRSPVSNTHSPLTTACHLPQRPEITKPSRKQEHVTSYLVPMR